jgi:hypothetical protein
MKNITLVVMCLVIGGNILNNSWTYNELNPIEYARAEEIVEPEVVLIEPIIEWTPERIEQEIEEQAEKYGADAGLMKRIIACESNGSTTIQSYHKRPDGSREQSYGLVQIYLPAHPNVTYEQAIDPQFAIEFMAKNIVKNPRMWSCYKEALD